MSKYLTSMPHWAHACWDWLHSSGVNLRPETIRLLSDALPCGMCRYHMKEYITTNDVTEPVDMWLIDFHNDINRRNNKTIISYEKALENVNCIETLKRFVQFSLATAFVLELDHSRSGAFVLFFCNATIDTGLAHYTHDHENGHLAHQVYMYFNRCGLLDMTFNDVLMDYIPVDIQSRFTQNRNSIRQQIDPVHSTVLIIFPITLMALVILVCIVLILLNTRKKKVI